METPGSKFKVGDSVRVKKEAMCPDFEDLCIEGWQGRVAEITELEDGSTGVYIRWDCDTLKNMPGVFIDQSEEDGVDYASMYLDAQEVELAKARDTEKDVSERLNNISREHSWSWLGEQGKRIQKALAGVDEEDEMEVFRAWAKHLGTRLVFPFDAEVSDFQEGGPLQEGDKVSVKKIYAVNNRAGILVKLRHGRKKYAFPLCDLEALDKDSLNYQALNDFRVWFANR